MSIEVMCPQCDRRLANLVFLWVCAHCEMAWHDYEVMSLWHERRVREALESK